MARENEAFPECFGQLLDSPKIRIISFLFAGEQNAERVVKIIVPFRVEVPPESDVHVSTSSAHVELNGALGEANVKTASGDITADEVKRIHDRKMERLPKLKEAMQQMLMDSAKSMDPVPADEQIVLAISFFYWNWENKDGLPAQIVMHAPKKLLLDARASAAAKSFILSDEF